MPRHGIGRHTVDLAVGHRAVRDRYLVAVDGDGPAYAAIEGVRARDRLRPEQLEALGWRHLRVWSTDLYRDPAREVARIVAAVREQVRAGQGAEAPMIPGPEAHTPATGPAPQGGEAAASPSAPGQVPPSDDEASAGPPTVPSTDEAAATASGRPARAVRAPEQTRDDTDRGWGERRDEAAHDAWLQEQRPPHWE